MEIACNKVLNVGIFLFEKTTITKSVDIMGNSKTSIFFTDEI